METLDKLRSKHERRLPEPVRQPHPPADSIKDPVDIFLNFISGCAGFQLLLHEGKPTLHFEPSLDTHDADRWSQACQASQLMMAAADEIKDRIRRRKLKLLPHPGYGKDR